MPHNALLKRIQRKITYKGSKNLPPIETSENSPRRPDSPSTYTAAATEFPFHLEPKRVRAARHDSHPQQLPSPDTGVSDVRYFLYTLLTSRRYKCAKEFPEWVLEACIAWSEKGNALYAWSDEDLRNICPRQAIATDIISNKHKPGSPCPPAARAMIGEVVARFVCDKRTTHCQKEQVQQRWAAELHRADPVPQMAGFYATGDLGHNGTSSVPSLQALSTSSQGLPLGAANDKPLPMTCASSIDNVLFQHHDHTQSGTQMPYVEFFKFPRAVPSFSPAPLSDASSMSSLSPGDSISDNLSDSTVKTSLSCSSHELSGAYSEQVSCPRRPYSLVTPDDSRSNADLPPEMREFKKNVLEHYMERRSENSPARYRNITWADNRPYTPVRPSLLRTATTLSDHQRDNGQTIRSSIESRPKDLGDSINQNGNSLPLDQTRGRCLHSVTTSSMAEGDETSMQDSAPEQNVVVEQGLRHDSAISNTPRLGGLNQIAYSNTSPSTLPVYSVPDNSPCQEIDTFQNLYMDGSSQYDPRLASSTQRNNVVDFDRHSQATPTIPPIRRAEVHNQPSSQTTDRLPSFHSYSSSGSRRHNQADYGMIDPPPRPSSRAASLSLGPSFRSNTPTLHQSRSVSTLRSQPMKDAHLSPRHKTPDVRPPNNYKVDTYALDQAERIRSRGAIFAKTKGNMNAMYSSHIARSNSLHRTRSEGSGHGEMDSIQGPIPQNDPAPRLVYMNPDTGRRRATLIEAIEEREIWDGRAQRGHDSGMNEGWRRGTR